MSFTAEGWAWEQHCPSSSAKTVLVCLGWYADHLGSSAYPSMATICRRTQLVDRTVRKAIADLIRTGLIEREFRTAPNNRCISSLYRLAIRETTPAKMQEHGDDPTPANMPEVFGVGEEPLPPQKRTPSHNAPLQNSTHTPANQQGNPSLEPSKKDSSLRSGEAAPPPTRERRQDDLFAEGIALTLSLSGVRDENHARSILASARKAKHKDADILAALRRAQGLAIIDPRSWLIANSAPNNIDQLFAELGVERLFGPDATEAAA